MRDFQPWPTGGAVHPRAASVERPGSAAALLPASARLSLGAGLGPAARRKRKWPRPQGGGARRGAELPGAAPRRRLPRRAAAPRAARHKLSAGRRGRVAARRCPGTSLSRSREGGGWGAAPERGGRARAAAGGGGGGGSAVSGAGRLRPPGILQHRRAALRPPPVPGTAAQPPGPASKLSEGGGRGGSGADRGLPLGRVGAAERGERLRGSDSF